MKKSLLLWMLLTVCLFSQYSVQNMNPSLDLGNIYQAEYLSDTKVILASAKQNRIIVYEINPQLPQATPKVLYSEHSDGISFTVQRMKFFNEQRGIVHLFKTSSSGNSQSLLTTLDGGLSWTSQFLSINTLQVDFRDVSNGVGVTNTGELIITTNGGGTWNNASTVNLPYRYFYRASYGNDQTIAAYSTDTLWFGFNSGTNWGLQAVPNGTYGGFRFLEAYGSNKFGYVTNTGMVLRIISSGGAITFSEFNTELNNIDQVSFSDSAFALLPPSDSVYLYNNYNTTVNKSFHRYAEKVKARSSTRLLILGQYGSNLLSISEDGGVTFRPFNGFRSEVWGVDFVNSSVGYISGYFGPTLKTIDGGRSWSTIYTPPSKSFVYDVTALTEQVVIIREFNSTGKAQLLRSSDGGVSWAPLTGTSWVNVLWFQFLDPFNGYISGEGGKLYATIDGGQNWNEIYQSPYGNISSFFYLNRTQGWAQAGAKFLRTTTGGLLWDSVSSNFYGAFKMQFLNANTGYLISAYPYYFGKTTDGGQTWVYAPGSNYYDFAAPDENNLFLAKYIGGTYHSTNGGGTYQLINGSDFYPQRMDLLNNRTVIVTAFSNRIQKILYSLGNVISIPKSAALTGDTIEVPIELNMPPDRNYQAMQFTISGYTDKLEYLSASFSNTLLGGEGWINSINPASNSIRLAASAPTSITSSGTLVKLRFKVNTGASGYIPLNFSSVIFNTGVVPTDTINGWVKVEQVNLGDVDINGTVQAFDASLVLQHLTIPGGIPLSNVQKKNANVTTDNTISALDASVILRYVTGIVTTLPYGGTGAAAGLAGMTDQVSTPGALLEIPVRINNGGNLFSFEGTFVFDPDILTFNSIQWQPILAPFMKESRAIGNRIYIAGAGLDKLDNLQNTEVAKLYFTVKPNPGQNHTQVTLEKLRLNENPAVVNSASAGVSITTGIENTGEKPVEYMLMQNYPNPFNPATQIVYGLPADGRVVLELFDIMGKKLATLVDEQKSAGYHAYQFDSKSISGITSGVYFYRISANGFVSTKKLMLVK